MTWTNGIATLHHADAREIPLPDQSVHCVVTSSPYWGLRSYDLEDTGIGLEPTLAEHLDNIVAVGREVWRVLRDDGSFWLNYGDAYSSGNGGDGMMRGQRFPIHKERRSPDDSLPPKNLMGLPWRIAFALQDDGWYLRSAIVWHKPNPMPESARDRPTSAYEMVFLLTKQPRYYYDAEAIRTASDGFTKMPDGWDTGPGGHGTYHRNGREKGRQTDKQRGHSRRHAGFNDRWDDMSKAEQQSGGANSRNVWSIPTQGRPDAHFATFPDELPRRCILAGTSERGVCADCGAPWARETTKTTISDEYVTAQKPQANLARNDRNNGHNWKTTNETTGWQPTCECNAATVPATVLDPFIGSGTTCAVAQSLGRHSVGLDLNREYLTIAQRRIEAVSLPMALL